MARNTKRRDEDTLSEEGSADDIYDRIEAIASEYDATVGQTKRADGTRTITVNLDAPKGE